MLIIYTFVYELLLWLVKTLSRDIRHCRTLNVLVVDRAILRYRTVTWPCITTSYPSWSALTYGVLQRECESVVTTTMKINGRGGHLTPATQKPLNRWPPKFVRVATSVIYITMRKFIQIGLGVSVLRMRDFQPLGTKWLGYFLGVVLEKGYSRDARTDFDAKYVKRARKCLLGVAKPNSKVSTPIFPQNPIFWPHSTRQNFFRPKSGYNIGRLESKRPLIVVVAE